MSQDWFGDVLDFHVKFDCLMSATPSRPSHEIERMKWSHIEEEYEELGDATVGLNGIEDLPEIADAIADLIYTLLGYAIVHGIDIRPVWDAVHAANMAKVSSGRFQKVRKPPGWSHPDIEAILAEQKPLPLSPQKVP